MCLISDADEWYDEALPGDLHSLVGKAVSDCSSFCGMNKKSSPIKRPNRCKSSGQLAMCIEQQPSS